MLLTMAVGLQLVNGMKTDGRDAKGESNTLASLLVGHVLTEADTGAISTAVRLGVAGEGRNEGIVVDLTRPDGAGIGAGGESGERGNDSGKVHLE